MTVDELLGPELTAELGIEEPEGSDPPAAKPSEAPTMEQPIQKPVRPPKPEIQDEIATKPTADDSGFSHDGHATAVMGKPALDQLKSELLAQGKIAPAEEAEQTLADAPKSEVPAEVTDEKSAEKPVPAPIQHPKDTSGKTRVPLPPAPGKPLSRGRIPSITPKKPKPDLDATDDQTLMPPGPSTSDFGSENIETRIDYKVPAFAEQPESPEKPEESSSGWPDVVPVPESSQPAAKQPDATEGTASPEDNPFAQEPVNETVQLQLGELKPRDPAPPDENPAPEPAPPSVAPMAPREDSGLPVPGALPRFPSDEARILWSALRSWFRNLPTGYRTAGIAAPPVALLGFVLLVILLAGPSTESAYLVADHSILPVPTVEDTVYASVGALARNEKVLVLDRIGTFVLVRDPEGRIGWVQEDYLSEEVPPIGPDLEFTRCYRRSNEDTVAPCQERARFQAHHCMAHCDSLEDPTPCQIECQSHQTTCENNCPLTQREQQAAAAVPELPPAEELPAETGEGAAEEVESESESEGEVTPSEEEEEQPKKKKKKRKKRKKKKKKR